MHGGCIIGASLSEPHLVCPAEVLSSVRTSSLTRMVTVNVIADSPRVWLLRLALHAYG